MTAGSVRLAAPYLVLFAALYALQGVVVAYFFNFNQGYLAAATPPVPLGRIGWVQTAVTVPFVLKFLAGPISDRFSLLGLGHRQPYVVVGLVVQSLGLVGLTWIDPGRHLGGFAAVATLAVAGLALYDTCCDGMVIDLTPPADRQRVQGTLVASRFLATMACSFWFGRWLAGTGTGPGRGDGVLWACALLGLPPLALALALPEGRGTAAAGRFRWEALGVLIRTRSLVLLAFGALYATVAYGVEINLSPYYTALGYGPEAIGGFGALRYLGRAVGALALPLLAWRMGRRATLIVGLLALAVTTLGQLGAVGPGRAGFWGFAFGAANGWDDALFNVLCMEASDPRMAASTYALFMAVSNLSTLGGGLFATAVEADGGRFERVLAACAVLPLLALAAIGPLARPAASERSDA